MKTLSSYESLQESCRVVQQPGGHYAVQVQKFCDPSVILGDVFGSIKLATYPGGREVRRFPTKTLAEGYIARRARMLQIRIKKGTS